jgi:CRISPR-associated protein Csm2
MEDDNMSGAQETRITAEQIREIIQQHKPKELVEYAEEIAKVLVNERLTTSQIRSFFSEVRLIEGIVREKKEMTPEVERRLYLLKPKLAYQARQSQGAKELEKALKPTIDCAVESKENFLRFIDFFEAILAYHKAKGGS